MRFEWALSGARRLDAWWRAHTRAIDWIVLVAGVAGAIWLWFSNEPPGYAIGLLAAVAAVMTFSRPNALQRVIVIALAVSLFVIEVRAISRERVTASQDAHAQLSRILTDNREKTNAILADNQRRFEITANSLSELGTLSKQNLTTAQHAVQSMMGGTAFPVLWPFAIQNRTDVSIAMENAGKFTLTGLSLGIWETRPDSSAKTVTLPGPGPGTLPPGQLTLIGILPDAADGNPHSYEIVTSDQNGTVNELLLFRRRVDGEIEYTLDVNRLLYWMRPGVDNSSIPRTSQKFKKTLLLHVPWTTDFEHERHPR